MLKNMEIVSVISGDPALYQVRKIDGKLVCVQHIENSQFIIPLELFLEAVPDETFIAVLQKKEPNKYVEAASTALNFARKLLKE